MRIQVLIGVVFGVLLTSAPASAFELTPAAPVDTGTPGVVIAPSMPNAPAALTEEEKSQEAVIPGLGSIGLIPKLDFGLELLYSGNDPATGAPTTDGSDDGVAVRGAIKHSF